MNDKTLVSIIMPTYKGASIIHKSIESVIAQTYQNWELIIVDDNGVDTPEQLQTESVIAHYVRDKRIKYIKHQKNSRGSVARNTGIKNSTGSLLAFLDDDDCFVPDKIQKQVDMFANANENLGMVYGGLTEISSDGKKYIILPSESGDFTFDYLACKLYVCSSCLMVRRNVVEKIGYWDESFIRHQDMEFVVRVSSVSEVDFINESLIYKYREDRNLSKDPVRTETMRLYYLEKMRPYINVYDSQKQQKIYFANYLPIGKAYLKKHNVKKALEYAIKSRKPISMILIYIRDMFKYLNK